MKHKVWGLELGGCFWHLNLCLTWKSPPPQCTGRCFLCKIRLDYWWNFTINFNEICWLMKHTLEHLDKSLEKFFGFWPTAPKIEVIPKKNQIDLPLIIGVLHWCLCMEVWNLRCALYIPQEFAIVVPFQSPDFAFCNFRAENWPHLAPRRDPVGSPKFLILPPNYGQSQRNIFLENSIFRRMAFEIRATLTLRN